MDAPLLLKSFVIVPRGIVLSVIFSTFILSLFSDIFGHSTAFTIASVVMLNEHDMYNWGSICSVLV